MGALESVFEDIKQECHFPEPGCDGLIFFLVAQTAFLFLHSYMQTSVRMLCMYAESYHYFNQYGLVEHVAFLVI